MGTIANFRQLYYFSVDLVQNIDVSKTGQPQVSHSGPEGTRQKMSKTKIF